MDELSKKIMEGKSCLWFDSIPQTEPIQIENRFYRVLHIYDTTFDKIKLNGMKIHNGIYYYNLAGYNNPVKFVKDVYKLFSNCEKIYVHFIAYQTTIGE